MDIFLPYCLKEDLHWRLVMCNIMDEGMDVEDSRGLTE